MEVYLQPQNRRIGSMNGGFLPTIPVCPSLCTGDSGRYRSREPWIASCRAAYRQHDTWYRHEASLNNDWSARKNDSAEGRHDIP